MLGYTLNGFCYPMERKRNVILTDYTWLPRLMSLLTHYYQMTLSTCFDLYDLIRISSSILIISFYLVKWRNKKARAFHIRKQNKQDVELYLLYLESKITFSRRH